MPRYILVDSATGAVSQMVSARPAFTPQAAGSTPPAAWSAVSTYTAGSSVLYSGHAYKALAPANYNRQPDVQTEWWTRGTAYLQWDSGVTYNTGDAVHGGTQGYASNQDENTGNDLSDTDWWNPIGAQVEWNSAATYSTSVSCWYSGYMYTAIPTLANYNRQPDVQTEWWEDQGVLPSANPAYNVFPIEGDAYLQGYWDSPAAFPITWNSSTQRLQYTAFDIEQHIGDPTLFGVVQAVRAELNVLRSCIVASVPATSIGTRSVAAINSIIRVGMVALAGKYRKSLSADLALVGSMSDVVR